jgi:hypothetical protein
MMWRTEFLYVMEETDGPSLWLLAVAHVVVGKVDRLDLTLPCIFRA